ncbi:MAG: Hsp20/alpha crystallin family protein [Candidatus Staskawiczbacteria bacterium]|nr:Hsp20/alpha crystallin family protein [Candidatus Staskawiczbacteria bacterium]
MPRTKKMKPAQEEVKIESTEAVEAVKETPANHDIFNTDGELVVDVFETNAEFVVMATIAGVAIKDLDISVEKDMMIISGDRKHPHQEHEKKFFFQECYFGPFSRKIVLPENLHTQKALAEMDKGILTVKIPKHDEQEKTDVKTV